MTTSILWFRRDLRLHANPALDWACDNSAMILPVFIHAPQEEQPWAPGGASRWWLHHSLWALDQQLRDHGLKLHFFAGPSEQIIARLARETGAEQLVFNKLYEPNLHARDLALQKKLSARLQITAYDSSLLFPPGTVLNQQQQPYKVFTPFYNKVRPLLNEHYSHYAVRPVKSKLSKMRCPRIDFDVSLKELGLLDSHHWYDKLHDHWQPGEQQASKTLRGFLKKPLADYKTARDLPAVEGTSRLSPHLHFGETTPQQVFLAMQPLLNETGGAAGAQSAETFVKQLIWREFAHHVLWHFPHTDTQSMNARYTKSFWRSNKRHFHAWTRGQTGIPIVDAGMKQLWETGWMHNRVRMIVSSYLTKNLGINWVQGAKWFWDTLVDADLANNSLGWQWVAGSGVDAAPYYRIFNPITQTKRYDPEYQYIKTWVPEYSQADYPSPLVDLAESRKQALDRYKQHIIS